MSINGFDIITAGGGGFFILALTVCSTYLSQEAQELLAMVDLVAVVCLNP